MKTTFDQFNLSKPIQNALGDLGFTEVTPIQEKAYSVVASGRDVVGIAQTGTGKTLAYLLPIVNDLKFSEQISPRILIVVPTRELVVQVVESCKALCQYKSIRVLGVYGGTNINTQAKEVIGGVDILVATPGRLFDLAVARQVKLKTIQKLVLDEVDVLLDLGFRIQLNNLFDILPPKRQNILFSATMTDEVNQLIGDIFNNPIKVEVAMSGEPLKNIKQSSYFVPNFYTKVSLLQHLLANQQEFTKVLVFISTKKLANLLFDTLMDIMPGVGVIHADKEQNYRLDMVEKFDSGQIRILIATDVIARGLDFDRLSHVINFDTPNFPENYIHRIGRTGRAGHDGKSILFFTAMEEEDKIAIELLMNYEIPKVILPDEVDFVPRLIPDEKPKIRSKKNRKTSQKQAGEAFHEKKDKNKKVNLGGVYHREIKFKYNKPKTKGDKFAKSKKKKK